MAMVLKVDKFGRVLIPKKVRQEFGIQPGNKVDLKTDTELRVIQLHVRSDGKAHRLARMPSGFPYLDVGPPMVDHCDTVEIIRQSRMEYLDRKLGL